MLSEFKQNVLRSLNYVYLDGAWRHKGGAPSLSSYAVELFSDEEFEVCLNRYIQALKRLHTLRLGLPLR